MPFVGSCGSGSSYANRDCSQVTRLSSNMGFAKEVLADRKPFGVRCDVLPIPIHYTISGTTRHQTGTGFDHGVDLLAHHQMHLIQSVTATASELEHPKPDHVTS